MNEHTKSSTANQQNSIAGNELLFAGDTVGTGVVTGAIFDPKLPPLSGD